MHYYAKGDIVEGTVTRIENYGIFVNLSNSCKGMIHISEISDKYVKDIYKIANVGDSINVKIVDGIADNSKLKLSINGINYKNSKKAKIIETPHGFSTLEKRLPYWINEQLNNK